MEHAEEQIPEQFKGGATDYSEECRYQNIAEAHKAFQKAAGRLLNVNEWYDYAGPGSSRFCLTNNEGKPVNTLAAVGMLINIDLPAPGSGTGEGVEWVMIEQVDAKQDAQVAEEFVAMTVRPIPNPHKTQTEIAHFYQDIATSTFTVKRIGTTVHAAVHGRNEVINNNDVNLHDRVRNTLVAFGARFGLAGPQWKKLVKGLLE